ncbi:Peptidyl-tRNA hydrolase [Sulfitobacter sp. DSM 110093]|uniref:aminoacyl-tRNA hydrolase n=1 Tax=Sulfitobacter sp. DSM 110093 TaxID=2883127 RepID=UPI001FACD459|nr:aminoacyl-tRNA hydrolase [Sulfitobacter sp. DSM 110093]UOA32573.1 Peptidyl-tRNA hydrolase [Sulfitobacter sp. DSM 110093]
MKLIVGLGNPGAKYARNRHNIGFMALDRIADVHGFAAWKGKFQGSVSEGRFGSDRAALLKPETFMNNSGQSVQAAMKFYKIDAGDVIVFHDELDLAPGKVKCKTSGGHAGHNGLRSIHAHIGADYDRVRMGIGHPGHKDAVAGYVLRDFPKADEGWLDDVLRGISDGAADLVRGDTGRFMNAVALRVAPPRSGTGSKGPQKPAEAKPQAASAKPATPEPEAEAQSPLQKLMDRFR